MSDSRAAWHLAGKLATMVLSLVFTLVALECALRAAAFVFLLRQDMGNRSASGNATNVPTVLCIGESTTALGGDRAYPRQLEGVLRELGQNVHIVNKGIPAVTTDVIISRLPQWIDESGARIVVAMMGINDPPDANGPPKLSWLASLRVYKAAAYIVDGLRRRFGTTAPTAPSNGGALADAERLMRTGRYADARTLVDAELARHPADPAARLEMGRILYALHDPVAADGLLTALADEAPTDVPRQLGVATTYLFVDALMRSTTRVPDDVTRTCGGGACDVQIAAAGRARAILERTFALRPAADVKRALASACHVQADFLARAGRPDEGAAALDRAEQLAIPDLAYLLHQHRALVAEARGDAVTAADELAAMRRLRVPRADGLTAQSFAALRRIAAEKHVRLVAVQYPLRNVAEIEQFLEHDPTVVYVDNERVFREALAAHRWDDVFTDRFAGDFGHLTQLGNRILATSVARGVVSALDADGSRDASAATTAPAGTTTISAGTTTSTLR